MTSQRYQPELHLSGSYPTTERIRQEGEEVRQGCDLQDEMMQLERKELRRM